MAHSEDSTSQTVTPPASALDEKTLRLLADAFAIADENSFIADVKAKYEKTGTLSEKQIAAVIKAKEKFDIEFIAPSYKIGERIQIVGKIARVEPTQAAYGYRGTADLNRYVVIDDIGMAYYIATAAKKLTSFLNLMATTQEEFKIDGVVQWRPDNAKMPVIISKKGLVLEIIE